MCLVTAMTLRGSEVCLANLADFWAWRRDGRTLAHSPPGFGARYGGKSLRQPHAETAAFLMDQGALILMLHIIVCEKFCDFYFIYRVYPGIFQYFFIVAEKDPG